MNELQKAIHEEDERGRKELVNLLRESPPSEIDVVVDKWMKAQKIRYAEIVAKYSERPITLDTLLG